MHYFITGGAGFIGHHLTARLLADGHQVTTLDDLSTGSYENVIPFLSHPNYYFQNGSVLEEATVSRLVKQADMVVHLAAAVGVRLIVAKPVQVIETNVMGTEMVLRAAARFGRKVFLASTSEVYGKNPKQQFSEDDDMVMGAVTKHRWSYACSKSIDEFLGLAYHKSMGLPVVIARFFNTIGPRQTGQYGMVVPRFMRQALANEPITIYGDGLQSRCFTDVRDVVKALLILFEHPSAEGEVFNIGNDQSITILQLAEKIKALTASFSRITFTPYEKAYEEGFEDMRHRRPDVSKLERLTGFRPKTKLEDALTYILDDMAEPTELCLA